MKRETKSEAVILRQKAKELLKMKILKSGLLLSEDEMQELIHELNLNEMERSFELAMEAANLAWWKMDLTTGVVTFGKHKAEMLGFPPENFKHYTDFMALVHPEDQEKTMTAMKKHLDGSIDKYEVEYRILTKSNGYRWFYDIGSIVNKDEHGKPLNVNGFIIDICDRKHAELALRNSETYLRTLVQTIPDLIWVKDLDGVYLSCNYMFGRFFGATEADIVGKTDYDFVNPEMADFFRKNDQIAMAAGKPTSNEEWVTFADGGHLIFLETIKSPIYDSTGKMLGVLGIGRDLTNRKNAELNLQQSEEKFRSYIDHAPDGIFVIDETGRYVDVNEAGCRMSGYSRDEILNLAISDLLAAESLKLGLSLFIQLIQTGTIKADLLFKDKGGNNRWWSLDGVKLTETRFLGFTKDITERKQSEEKLIIANEELVFQNEEKEKRAAELIIAKEKAEESDRLKSAFLANMSHEVRTPLNSIIGFSELLVDSDFEDDQKNEFVQHIILSGNNLLSIISDIMDISKMESGEFKIRKSQINVQQFISIVYKRYFLHAESTKLEIKLSFPEDSEDLLLVADPDRLNQIFTNLIGNAFKFTETGQIEIGYQSHGKMLEFFVRDTGIGIPAEYHDKIFDRFHQLETGNSRKYGGNGLGLAISKNLVKIMGGEIWFESEPGKGSVFYFTLPLAH